MKTDTVVMQRNKSRLRQAMEIIEIYNPSKPLNTYLFGYYKKNKQMGSSDRRQLSSIIYQYLRLGKNLADLSVEKKIAIASLLCNSHRNPFIDFMIQEYSEFQPTQMELPLADKIALVLNSYPDFSLHKIFPFSRYLSKISDIDLFIQSHLIQPKVWIRIKKNRIKETVQEFEEQGFVWEEASMADNCLSFTKHYPLHLCKTYLNGAFEIQDVGSQMTGTFLKPSPNEVWWDACCGSGGKSLMLLDQEPAATLFLTDIRESIINNLIERFKKANINNFKALVADLEKPNPIDIPFEFFDGIILDVPCSGSGTWTTTPENLSAFDVEQLTIHHKIQTTIAQHALPYLKKGKPLIYITCSVYKQENEDVIKFLCENFNLTLESQQVIEGYKYGAATFFAARMIKN